MKLSYFCALCLVSVCVTRTDAQFPFMGDFMGGFSTGMNNMMRNLGGMMGNLQTNLNNMGQQMSQTYARQQAIAETYARDLPPGQGRYIDDGVFRGYVFRNRGGGLSFSLNQGGGDSNGFFVHTGPDGQTFSRSW